MDELPSKLRGSIRSLELADDQTSVLQILISTVPLILRSASRIDSLTRRVADLSQLLAHIHLHMTNDENFGADELEADLRKLNEGKWIDTESLLIDARATITKLTQERDDWRAAHDIVSKWLKDTRQ